jgi:hypothetical protein
MAAHCRSLRLCRQLEEGQCDLKIAMSQVKDRVGTSIDRKQSWLKPLIDQPKGHPESEE